MGVNSNVLILKNVRLSFPTLGEPEYFGGAKTKPTDKRRWSATVLIPKDDPQRKLVDETIKFVATEKWKDKAASYLKTILTDPKASCFTDGERKEYEGYQGMMALSAHRNEDKGRPLVIDSDKSPIYQPNGELYEGKAGRIYSGCYVNIKVEFWAQQNTNGRGIRATLLVVQRNRDGDAFAGGVRPSDDDFEEVTEGAGADDMT